MFAKSISKNIAAQIFSQASNLLIQLGMAPFLISYWGIEIYGSWLILTTIPTYLMLSDFGFTFVAKNDMAIRVAQGDKVGAITTYQSIFVLLTMISVFLIGLVWLVVAQMHLSNIFNMPNISEERVSFVIVWQTLTAVIYQYFLLMCAAVRCEGRAATETFISALCRILESIVVVLAAKCSQNLATVAFSAFVARLFCTGSLLCWLRKASPWITLGFRYTEYSRIKELSVPSLSYMLVPIANAVLIQGPIVILGIVSNATVVAMFSITRTVSRLGMAGGNILNFAFTPEYSFLFGKHEKKKFIDLIKLHMKLAVTGMVFYVFIMSLFGKFGVAVLSHNRIQFDWAVCAFLAMAVAMEIMWTALFSPLCAINKHKAISICLVIISLTSVCGSIFVSDVKGFSFAVFFTHLLMLLVTGFAFRGFLEKNLVRNNGLET